MKKKLVILTGAGISAESGIQTFRSAAGLWNNHNLDEVATPMGWLKNPKLVLEFYNERRKGVLNAEPNLAHKILAEFQEDFDMTIITQNIDDLHERAGSKEVLHLHGEILKSQSSKYPEFTYECKTDINIGDKCDQGSQLRPFVVWFGESVPMILTAEELSYNADIFVVIGTSLQVYPAAGLIAHTKDDCLKVIIDPEIPTFNSQYRDKITAIRKKATEGIIDLKELLYTKI